MVNLELELDEGIVLQTTEVERYGVKELSLNEMVLTNKNIVCVYEKSTGLFSKPETIIEKIPLYTIKVANGQAQVMIHDSDEYGKGLQVLFISGHREHFIFSDAPKKTMPLWINEINKILVGEPIIPVQVENTQPTYNSETKPKKSFLGGLAGALGSLDVQSAVEKVQTKIAELPQHMAEKAQTKIDQMTISAYSEEENVESAAHNVQPQQPTSDIPPIPDETKKMFCSNCGTQLNVGSKFCHGCGSAVGTVPQPKQSEQQEAPPISSTVQTNYTERQQEFAGKILKCPNCGAVITQTTAICPDCGIQITGRAAVSSVQQFKDQLMAIESTRKGGLGGVLGVYTPANKSDIQKLSLIRNFPIPNSIDDCLEFMMLAIANIDVSLSKNTLANRMNNNGQIETGATIGRTISNAWVAKMEQVYKKAEIVFPNDPVFSGIQKMYFDKMKELKIKIK